MRGKAANNVPISYDASLVRFARAPLWRVEIGPAYGGNALADLKRGPLTTAITLKVSSPSGTATSATQGEAAPTSGFLRHYRGAVRTAICTKYRARALVDPQGLAGSGGGLSGALV